VLVVLVAALLLAFTTTAVAEPLAPTPVAAKKKKCFKKKRGKRVRVKCKKKVVPKTPTSTQPTPTSPTAPGATDPVRDRMNFLLSGEMMRWFANGGDAGGIQADSTLHTCSDHAYHYFAQSAVVAGGVSGISKTEEHGTWSITQAELSPAEDEIFGTILLTPNDGSAPHSVAVNLVDDGSGGIITLLNRERWFRVASTLCG
jgi:hypothetical protein